MRYDSAGIPIGADHSTGYGCEFSGETIMDSDDIYEVDTGMYVKEKYIEDYFIEYMLNDYIINHYRAMKGIDIP